MHRINRIFSGNDWLAFLEIRKSPGDHRRSQPLVQQPPVLIILCIHVQYHYGKPDSRDRVLVPDRPGRFVVSLSNDPPSHWGRGRGYSAAGLAATKAMPILVVPGESGTSMVARVGGFSGK